MLPLRQTVLWLAMISMEGKSTLRSAPPIPKHHRLLSPNNGPCFSAWDALVGVAPRGYSWCACRSVKPWFGAWYGYDMTKGPDRWMHPPVNDPRVLSSRQVRRIMFPAGGKGIILPQTRLFDPGDHCRTRRRGGLPETIPGKR